MSPVLKRAVRSVTFLVAVTLVAPAHAIVVTLTGTLFDVTYENSGFLFQTGTVPDPITGSPVPVFEQLGGFSIVAPDTVRYSLRPKEVFGDPATIVAGGSIRVGGSALSTDSASDAATFTVLPKGGNQALSVQMLTVGGFDNSGTESATLQYVEGIQAAGASGSAGGSLGVFSSGALPSGASATFGQRGAPFDVAFQFTLDGTSSAFDFVSSAKIDHIDFKVMMVPEPQTWLLMFVGIAAVTMLALRRSALAS